jgi:hypothetical protein
MKWMLLICALAVGAILTVLPIDWDSFSGIQRSDRDSDRPVRLDYEDVGGPGYEGFPPGTPRDMPPSLYPVPGHVTPANSHPRVQHNSCQADGTPTPKTAPVEPTLPKGKIGTMEQLVKASWHIDTDHMGWLGWGAIAFCALFTLWWFTRTKARLAALALVPVVAAALWWLW